MEAGVQRDVALDVLRQFGVFVVDRGAGVYALGRNSEVPEIKRLPPELGRKMLGYFAERFGVPSHLFWHPDQVQPWMAAQAANSKRADPN